MYHDQRQADYVYAEGFEAYRFRTKRNNDAAYYMRVGAADIATAAYAFTIDAGRHSRIKLKRHLRIGGCKNATSYITFLLLTQLHSNQY